MTRTITRLFDSHAEAVQAVEDLERASISDDRISLVSNNADESHRAGENPSWDASGPLGDRDGDGHNDVAEGAGKGAATGGLLGGGAGLLAGLGLLAIPGVGPIAAVGWLTSTVAGAAIGAAAGGATGGLLGALKDAGHTNEEANVYSEGVRRGGSLVSVKADDGDADRIEQTLNGRRGIDASTRGDAYRQAGWDRFDPDAQPMSSNEIARDRQMYP